MINARLYSCICLLVFLISTLSYAQVDGDIDGDGLGQVIQIRTRFHAFVGKPSWLLIIRDVDHGQTIPYLYDIITGENFWLALTFSRNYLITVSKLQFSPYRHNPYATKITNNFCNLESNGRIIRGKSMIITITGELSPNPNTYTCHIMTYPDADFITVMPGAD